MQLSHRLDDFVLSEHNKTLPKMCDTCIIALIIFHILLSAGDNFNDGQWTFS